MLERYQRQNVSGASKRLTLDHFGLMWNQASRLHKQFLLRAAAFDEEAEPKYWGAYSLLEQRTLRATGLLLEELAQFQLVCKRKTKQLEARVNQGE